MRTSFIIIYSVFCVLLSGCFNPEDYEPKKSETEIDMSPPDTTVVANGASAAKIKFTVTKQRPTKDLPIILNTTLGSFVGGKGDSLVVSPANDYSIVIRLVSTSTGTAKVTAKIGEVTFGKIANVIFTKAFPDKISVSIDSFAIHNSFSSELVITASITQSTGGVASSGHAVEFSAVTESETEIGYFVNEQNTATSNTAGKVSIRFSVGNTNYIGRLKIIASTLDANGATINAETFLQVIE